MVKTRKTLVTALLSAVMGLAVGFGVIVSSPKSANVPVAQAATSYTTKDIAMMGRVAGWYGNGNFELRLTLGYADWSGSSAQKSYVGEADLATALNKLGFFDKIKLGDKTLREWGCTACYDNWYKVNSGEPDYTLMIPLAMGSENMSAATAAGIGANTPFTILEGALIPSDAYLQGDTSATVYHAGATYETITSDAPYGIEATAKTEVESVKYVQGHDGNNGYFGFSLVGDDYLGDGTTIEVDQNYNYENKYYIKVLVNGESGKTAAYGLFNLGSKGQGYFSFVMYLPEEEMESVTIPAGTVFPSRAMTDLRSQNSNNGVYIMYETQTDVTFYKQADGSWQKPLVEKETSVESAFVSGSEGDNFAFIKLATHDYPTEIDNWGGNSVKEFAAGTNFYTHVLIDDVALGSTGQLLLNVWGNKGVIAFRTTQGINATKITVLAGCQIPTYNAIANGEREVYVTTQDITFVKNASGQWEEYVPVGDFDTKITQVQFGRSTNVINFNLSVNDYPAPNGNDASTYNIGVDADKILSLNFLDNIIVDGYTLRSRYNRFGTSVIGSPWFWVNRFVGHNFAVRIPTSDGVDIGASKIVIRAGTQFPSMEYIKNGSELFYVTTEEVTYVRVSADKEVSWVKQATISFVADGDTIAELPYTVEKGIEGNIPEVPEKAGYKGVWSSYTLDGNNLVVNAVYTEHDFTELETNISKMQFDEGFLIVYLTNNDYPTTQGTIDVKARLSSLHFFDYVEVDGNKMASAPAGSDGAFFSVWNRWGSFATYLPGHIVPESTVVLKKGCQIPSYVYLQDANDKTCYVLTEDVTFVKEGNAWVRQGGDEVVSAKPAYDNDYILSDLYQTGYPASAELEKGYLFVDKSTGGNVYGYNTSQSFSITFDFSLNLGNNDLSAQGNYTTFSIAMATRGYNGGNAFGWNFYLYRPDNSNKCIEFFVGGAGQGSWEEIGIFEKGQTYRVTLGYKLLDAATGKVQSYLCVNGVEYIKEFTFGADYYNNTARYVDSIAFSTNSAVANGVLISDPGFNYAEDGRYTLTLVDGVNTIVSEKAWKYTLPELNACAAGKADNVFVGWTTDLNSLDTIYPAGYTMELTKDTTLYPVWLEFAMREGAAVRNIANESGLRFLVDINGASYQLGVSKNVIVGAGTLVVPTSYLDSVPFVHDSFPAGYYVDIPTDTWTTQSGSTWTYAAALINISPAQYTRSMSARGYLKIAYSDGTVGYIYTAYSKDLHARSVYEVATKAYKDNVQTDAVLSYVNSVADITISEGFVVSKNADSVGNYNLSSVVNGNMITITLDKSVKAVVINGVRILAGYEAEIVIGSGIYVVDGYKLNSNGLTITFQLSEGDVAAYYDAIVALYKDSNEYTQLHKQEIDSILAGWVDYSDAAENAKNAALLASIKTEVELAENVGATKLATPVLKNGLGYTVTWDAVANADYYFVTDDNDYRNGVYVLASEELSYKTEVVGKHNVTVTAYSYYDTYSISEESASFAAIEVKPVFSYKAMSDGLYKFSEADMKTMGLGDGLNTKNDGSSYYYDKSGKVYFAYYNKETGWSKNQGSATDWTSPEEFPAHAARLKAMGNNVIMISEGSAASLKEDSAWETSRLKYVMDTAWTLGMKVIVCDDVIYQKSKEVSSKSNAASVINGRAALLEKYIKHPAFFGFSLEDEPEPNSLFTGSEMESVGFMVQALKEKVATYGLSKANGNEPFFLACLYQYAEGFELASSLVSYKGYLEDWFDGTGLDYVYVDLYTGHAMGDETNRYEMTYDVLYGNGTNGLIDADTKFYQVITGHTQSKDYSGVLTEADMYMSMLYAAAHNVAGYSWFCYFPISGETAGSMVGFDGNGYGNGIGNGATAGYSYYNAAATAAYQYEIIQGILNGYSLKTRSYSSNLLTTTLTKSGAANITMYVNADTMTMSQTKTVTASGSVCYLVGYGLGDGVYYREVSGSVTLNPGQALICVA